MISQKIRQLALELFHFPHIGRGSVRVWHRNFLYFRQSIFTSLSWIVVEPLLYLFALGYGLGHYVQEIDGQNYAQFIAPAMMATSGMFVAFFEGTYSTYTKMTRLFTYNTILLTPLSTDEIVIGEILWITSKAFLSVVAVSLVLSMIGLVPIYGLAPALAMLFLMCWVFAAFGVLLAMLASSYEWFSYSQSGLIVPMSLFCGTYFPLTQLPDALIYVSYSLPLTHGLMSVRMFFSGEFNSIFFLNLIYLLSTAIILTNVASARFKNKIIA